MVFRLLNFFKLGVLASFVRGVGAIIALDYFCDWNFPASIVIAFLDKVFFIFKGVFIFMVLAHCFASMIGGSLFNGDSVFSGDDGIDEFYIAFIFLTKFWWFIYFRLYTFFN